MLYMPATTTVTPTVYQETQQNPLQTSTRYYMLQSGPIVPAVPILNTTYVYPRYGFVPKPVETSVTKDEIEKSQPTQTFQVAQPVQHVIHHHVQPCTTTTCAGYCELCSPWSTHSRPRSTSPKPYHHHHQQQQQQRHSRRDEFERDELDRTDSLKHETIDEKIERIRRELRHSSSQKHDNSTETPIIEHHIHHRPRSNSRPRSSSATRDPWRPSNQNDYPWRDAHLPAYRDITLARSQTPIDETRTWKETAHERSHENTKHSKSYHSKKDYIYRPKSETEARKWYTQSTGKDADREVHQALHGGTTTYKYTGSSKPYYDKQQSTKYEHAFYSDVPTTNTKTHTLRKIDSSQHHNLYACNEPCLHIVPKHGTTSDPPYMKILNAPVTYLH